MTHTASRLGITITLSLLIAFATSLVQAQESSGLNVSAFADIVFPVSGSPGSQVEVNQAEVDLEGEIGPDASTAMALAYDPEAETFALAVLAVELGLVDQEEFSAALTVGQFDIPFGIDYQVYASIDRRLVTAPLFVENTHEGWNDVGANAALGWGRFGADVFVINGSSCGRGTVCPDKAIVREDVKIAGGTRVHAGLSDGVEIGASTAMFRDVTDETPMVIWGADLQAAAGMFSGKAEYVSQTVDRGTTGEAENVGWYLQGMVESGRLFGVARYGIWDPELLDERPERLSLGFGYVAREGLEFRIEQDLGLQDLDDVTYLQMVMDFGAIH